MLELLGVVVTHYAWLTAWLASAALAGMAVQAGLLDFRNGSSPWPNFELAVFFSISTGLAVQIGALILLAAAGQLHATAVLSAAAVLAFCSMVVLWLRPECVTALWTVIRRPLREWLAILPVFLVIAAWLVRPLGAAAGSDSLAYHLPYARFYLEQGGLAVNETLRFPLHTHNVNLLYAAALLRPYTVESPVMAQLLHASMGWLSLVGIYGAARYWSSWATALAAALAVLLMEEFIVSFSMAFVDNGVMLFVTGAFLALALWHYRLDLGNSQPGWLWLAAILAGTAMGTKYIGAWFTVPLGLWLLWRSRSLNLTVRFALLVGATGLFWYVRSWMLMGNPLHPFAGEVFGYSIWSAQDLKDQLLELGSHGVEKTWLNLLLLPWKMFTDWQRFNGMTGEAGYLTGAFMLASVLLRWQRPCLRGIHLACMAYLVFWFFSSQVVRYLMIALPLMSLCTVVLWVNVLDGLRKRTTAAAERFVLPHRAGMVLLTSVLAVLFFFSGRHGYRDLLSLPLTVEKQQRFLAEKQPAYSVALVARADSRTHQGPLLQFNLQEIRWFYPGKVYGDWMGLHPYRKFGHVGPSGHWEINSGEQLIKGLADIGAAAVVYAKVPGQQFSPQPLDSYLREFTPVFENEFAVLLAPREMRWIAGKNRNLVTNH